MQWYLWHYFSRCILFSLKNCCANHLTYDCHRCFDLLAASAEAASADGQSFKSGTELCKFIAHLAFCSLCSSVDASVLDDDIAILAANDLAYSDVAYGMIFGGCLVPVVGAILAQKVQSWTATGHKQDLCYEWHGNSGAARLDTAADQYPPTSSPPQHPHSTEGSQNRSAVGNTNLTALQPFSSNSNVAAQPPGPGVRTCYVLDDMCHLGDAAVAPDLPLVLELVSGAGSIIAWMMEPARSAGSIIAWMMEPAQSAGSIIACDETDARSRFHHGLDSPWKLEVVIGIGPIIPTRQCRWIVKSLMRQRNQIDFASRGHWKPPTAERNLCHNQRPADLRNMFCKRCYLLPFMCVSLRLPRSSMASTVLIGTTSSKC